MSLNFQPPCFSSALTRLAVSATSGLSFCAAKPPPRVSTHRQPPLDPTWSPLPTKNCLRLTATSLKRLHLQGRVGAEARSQQACGHVGYLGERGRGRRSAVTRGEPTKWSLCRNPRHQSA